MRNMIQHVEAKMPVYPKRFHDIAAVKTYIINTSATNTLHDGHLTFQIIDSVIFQVAIRAYQNGEFYLNAPPPDKRALRSKFHFLLMYPWLYFVVTQGQKRVDAIEAAMNKTLPQIGSWPTGFTHVEEVKIFIAVVCAPIVNNLSFVTLDHETFKGYVLFHTARQAWEDGKYEMKSVPRMWKRIVLPTPKPAPMPGTLRGSSSPNPCSYPLPNPSSTN